MKDSRILEGGGSQWIFRLRESLCTILIKEQMDEVALLETTTVNYVQREENLGL